MYIKPTDIVLPIRNPVSLTTRGCSGEITVTAHDAVVAWRYVPGRKRFLLEIGQSFDAKNMLFGIAYHDGPNAPPTCLATFTDVTMTSSSDFNSTRRSYATCLGLVAAKKVRAGKLDPVDAFWFTANPSDRLRRHHLVPATIRKCNIRELTNGIVFSNRYLSSHYVF